MEPASKGRKRWSEQEDRLLRLLVDGDGGAAAKKRWKEVAAHLPGRTEAQCQHRWAKVLRPDLKRGPWTPEEDQKLRQLVAQQGGVQHVKWTEIASHLPGRLGKQCRERYINACDPSIRRDAWTAEEDAIVREAYLALGSRWKKIAALLKGRTENSIKNRFHSSAFRELRDQLQQGAAPTDAAPADDSKAKKKDSKPKVSKKVAAASAAPPVSAAAPSSSSSSTHTPWAQDASTSPGPISSASPTPPPPPLPACAAEAVAAPAPAMAAAAPPATTDFAAAAASEDVAMSAFSAESLLPTMAPASPWSPRDMASASFSSFTTVSAATSLSASTGSLLFDSYQQQHAAVATATAGPTAAGGEHCLPPPAAHRHELPANHDLAQWQVLPSLPPVAEPDPAATFLLI